jgi:hypothetical protein
MEQEIGRLQHGLDDQLRAGQEFAGAPGFVREQRSIARHFRRCKGPSKGFRAEGTDELCGALGVARRAWPARQQVVYIAATKSVAREFFGGCAISFRQQGCHALRRGLIFEAVDEIFLRKLICGLV